MLEERGYVTSVERDGRKVYTITDEGRRFLDEHSELEQEINDRLNDWRNPENTEAIRRTMREFGRLAELLSWEARKMDSEKLGRVRGILSRAYEDIGDILKD
jgi:DNA-binding PadR family transcriptional regulator